ncbi:hypothetical protein GCM10022419_114090 [Nonomuraea rosea]|uniref:Uncharacterized protein n=1 Tax=Nonomuraea rosea TaxID=638574 RepID=A0ABP6ZHX5_9ACTN
MSAAILGAIVDKHLPAFRHRSFHLYNVQPDEAGGAAKAQNKFSCSLIDESAVPLTKAEVPDTQQKYLDNLDVTF